MKIDTSSDLQTDLKDNFLRTDMSIVYMQTNNTLILIDSKFAAAKEKTIVDAKIMIKSRDDLDSIFSLKINDTVIERQENGIYLKQIVQFDHFQFVKIVDFIIIRFRNKIKLVLISKKQYVVQRAREIYIAFIYQSET
jgi:hypothetical protein